MINNILLGFEDTVRQPVLAYDEPEVNRIEFWGFRRQRQDRDVCGHDEIIGHVPARLIHDEDGMCVIGDMACDLSQMPRHGIGVAPRHDECRRLAELGADSAKDVGGPRTLIVRR